MGPRILRDRVYLQDGDENPDPLMVLLREVRDDQRLIKERLDLVEKDSEETLAKLNALLLAFPGGDMEGHRRYHESVIEWRELRNRMVRAALEQMVKAGSLAAVVWLLYAVWNALKMEMRK